MNNNFRGWKTVFSFTFHNSTKKGYKIVTLLVSLAIIVALCIVNIVDSQPKDEEKPSPITSVAIVDDTKLGNGDYNELMKQASESKYKINKYDKTVFTLSDDKNLKELQAQAADTTSGIVIHITMEDDVIIIESAIPDNSVISTGECKNLLEDFKVAFQMNKLIQTGATAEQMVAVKMPVQSTYHDVGEKTGMINMIINMIVPMFFGLIMYMMFLFNGQTVSKSVSSEKTSKLMETLMTSIHPYALITGKVLAVAASAMLQFLIWVISAIIGLYGGNAIAHIVNPEYENTVVTFIGFLRDNIGESALTIPAVILAVLLFCVGFLFYCVLAGLAGCMVSKPEDVASTQGLFIFPILVSWMLCYFSAAVGNTTIIHVARYIPFTIPFGLPVDLLTGVASIAQGVISLVILFAFSLLFIMFSAKLYKGLMLYHGEKLSLKTIGQFLKAKK